MNKKMQHEKYFSLRWKVFTASVCAAAFVIAPLLYFHLAVSAPVSRQFMEDSLSATLDKAALELNAVFREATTIAINLARQGELYHRLARSETGMLDPNEDAEKLIGSELARHIESFPDIVGAGIFYEPFVFTEEQKYRAFHGQWVPPVGPSRKVEYSMSRSNPKLDYHNQDWYRTLIPAGWNAKRHLYRDVVWTAPYRDQVSLVPITSVLTAMYSEDSLLLGLASVDCNLSFLTEIINNSRPTTSSIALLTSPQNKTFAAVSGLEGMNLEPVDQSPWMPYLLLNAPKDRFEMVPAYKDDGTAVRVYNRTLGNDMVYSLIIPENEVAAKAAAINRNFSLLICAAGILMLIGGWLFSRRLLGRLPEIVEIARDYASGRFDGTIQVKSGDELEILSGLLGDFRRYVESLTETAKFLNGGGFTNTPIFEDASDPARTAMRELGKTIALFSTELEQAASRIQAGETDFRFNSTLFSGTWQQNGKSLNVALNALEDPLQETVAVYRAVRQGRSPQIVHQRSGVFERHRVALNGLISKHQEDLRRIRLENESLELSRNRLREASEAKGRMLSGACNSFQNFLKKHIQLFADIGRISLASDIRRTVEACRSQASALLTQCNEIINYTQLEEGLIKISSARFNLYTTLFNIKDLLQVHANRRRQQLRLTIETGVPEEVTGDSRVLEGVLSHLLMQSVLHTEEGGVINLKVSKHSGMADVCTLTFSIIDTGGAGAAELRYSQIHDAMNTETPSSIGTGSGAMGLLIAERLINLMGGSLNIEMRPNVGVISQITIPFMFGLPQDSAEEEEASGIREAARLIDPSKHVLLVEDNLVNQKLTSGILKQAGYDVTIAGNGEEALSVIENQEFAMVLMDIALPLIDGIEVSRRIRASNKPYSSVPIIALTAFGFDHSLEKCRTGGMNGYLMKPLDKQALLDIVANFTGEKHGAEDKLKSDTNQNGNGSQPKYQ